MIPDSFDWEFEAEKAKMLASSFLDQAKRMASMSAQYRIAMLNFRVYDLYSRKCKDKALNIRTALDNALIQAGEVNDEIEGRDH
jgi:hypothetical protein